jgi:prepilin-type N-terminal cleavage/methylation domain-containing protein/prepilin-type processing-associated H-X9-DG protein
MIRPIECQCTHPITKGKGKDYNMIKRKGFTLIELLVVIAIIAILLAVLIPALNAAKKQVTGIVCMSHLNSIVKCWSLYIGDNDNKLCNTLVPRSALYNDLKTWLTAPASFFNGPYKDNAWWVNPPINTQKVYTGDPVPCRLIDEDNGNASGVLGPYIESTKILHCPADKTYLLSPDRGGMRTYSGTDLMNGERPNDRYCVRKFNEIYTPADKFVFLENTDFRSWNMGSWMFNYGDILANPPTHSWVDSMAVFHTDRNTFAFADGHAEKHKWEDGTTIKGAGGQNYLAPDLKRDLQWVAMRYIPGRR